MTNKQCVENMAVEELATYVEAVREKRRITSKTYIQM